MDRERIERTLKNFRVIRLPAMAEQVLMMVESNELANMTVEDVLERISTEELLSRKNNTINRLKKSAKLSQRDARLEDIDYGEKRKINKSIINQLATNDYIVNHRNVILLGACGTGKSYIANALGNHACESGFSTFYCRLFEFLDDCGQAQIHNGSSMSCVLQYAKFDVLILDDFLIHNLEERSLGHLFQLFDYRYDKKNHYCMFTT